jgi:hypothetical protein
VQDSSGKLFNYVDKNKKINFKKWSEDAHGRAIWALGYLYSSKYVPEDLKEQAEKVLLKALPIVSDIKSPRSIAFAIKGLYFYNVSKRNSEIDHNINKLAEYLASLYKQKAHTGWEWFEDYLTYSNSKLSEAMLYAYLSTGNKEYLNIGIESLNFLISKTFHKDMFVPIGQRSWYFKNKERSLFDQQPVDVAYTVQTLILANKITKEENYRDKAKDAFKWFLGKNMLNQVIYNEQTGGCHDGFNESAINLNQGAESTLSYLIGRLSLMNL